MCVCVCVCKYIYIHVRLYAAILHGRMDSYTGVASFIDTYVCYDSFAWHTCAMTHSYDTYVCHDSSIFSFIYGLWLIHICDYSLIYEPRLADKCAMTHSYSHLYMGYDSFIYVPWVTHKCAMTRSHTYRCAVLWDGYFHTCVNSFTYWRTCVPWVTYICAMTRSPIYRCAVLWGG